MSKKHTEKSVHIDPVKDQSILDELAQELEGTGATVISGHTERRHHTEAGSGDPVQRSARPYSEVRSGSGQHTPAKTNPVKKTVTPAEKTVTPHAEPVILPEITKAPTQEPAELTQTGSLDDVLEFISADDFKSTRAKRNASQAGRPSRTDRSEEQPHQSHQPRQVSRAQESKQRQSIPVEDLEEALQRNRRKPRIIIPIIMLAALAFFAVSYYMFMESVSMMFLVPVIVAAVLTVLFIIMQQARKQGVRILGRVLGIILAIILAVVGCGLTYLNLKLGHMMGQTADSTQMVVIVRMDDPAQTIEDAKDYTFGYEDRTQPQSMTETIADIETHIGAFERTKYESVEEEAEDLLDGDLDAVILNAIFIESLDDVIDDFSGQVRVIYTHEVAQAYLNMPEVKQGQSFNVLISGIDTYGEIASVSRSDVNQIMTVNPDTKQILLTSTPRDYFVPIPGISGLERDKLTHAGIYGIQATADTLGELYDIDINYYVRINFTSLIEVVDALGGVDVNSEVAFSAGGYDFVEGTNHLNGEQALAFSRARHQFAEGDNQRGKNQQYVLTAILNKMMSREALSNPVELFDSLSGFVQTNMSKAEFVRLAADILASGESYSIDRQQAEGTGGSDVT